MDFFAYIGREEMGVFKECKRFPMYEGNLHGVKRPTGESETQKLKKITTEMEMEPQNENLDTSFTKIYNMGQHFAEQMERNSFQHLNDVCDAHGQTVDAREKSPEEAFIELFEKVEIPLGKDGKLDLSGMQIVCGNDVFKAVQKFSQNPELTKRFEALMAKKEEKARAKEANRKLVG